MSSTTENVPSMSKKTLNSSIVSPWCNSNTSFTQTINLDHSEDNAVLKSAIEISWHLYFSRTGCNLDLLKTKLQVTNVHKYLHLLDRILVLSLSSNFNNDRIEIRISSDTSFNRSWDKLVLWILEVVYISKDYNIFL